MRPARRPSRILPVACTAAILAAPFLLPDDLRGPTGMALAAPPADAAAATALQEKIDRTLEARRWSDALPLIERFLKEVRRDPVMLYNAACCHAQLGERDAGAASLLDAVKAGFRDFGTMESDPDLEPLHDHPTYTAILEARDRAESIRTRGERPDLSAPRTADPAKPTPKDGAPPGGKDAPAAPKPPADGSARRNAELTLEGCPQLDEWKRVHGTKRYRYESDERRRLHYATCLDEETHKEMRELIEREADWLATNLFGDLPSYETLLAVPTPSDAKAYFADPTTCGIYIHSMRMLVARDIGESLQHEFVHLMHYGHMERLRQKHPIWIQEGIAALFEAFDLDGSGTIRFLPNTRHNFIYHAVKGGGAMEWTKLFGLSAEAFMDKGSGLYPEVRSIFLYLADRGKLKPFYEAYTSGFSEDPSGRRAIEKAFGKPLVDVERQWRDWVKAGGTIDDTIRVGDASLGISITETPGGVRIKETLRGSAVRAAGLRTGDIIVAVDGKAVRSSRELAVAIAARRVGETVVLRYRRGEDYEEAPVTLRALPSQLDSRPHP